MQKTQGYKTLLEFNFAGLQWCIRQLKNEDSNTL